MLDNIIKTTKKQTITAVAIEIVAIAPEYNLRDLLLILLEQIGLSEQLLFGVLPVLVYATF